MKKLLATFTLSLSLEPLQRSECNFINTVREGTAIAQIVNHPSSSRRETFMIISYLMNSFSSIFVREHNLTKK